MCKVVLEKGDEVNFTPVSNVFIDEYMSKANGEFVKVYLYLLRLLNCGDDTLVSNLSTEAMARHFDMLESDVVRALNYWSSKNLLLLSYNEKGEISSITPLFTVSSNCHESVGKSGHDMPGSGSFLNNMNNNEKFDNEKNDSASDGVFEIPKKRKYTPLELDTFSSNAHISDLMFLLQTYLGRTLNSTDIGSILYMVDSLGLDTDLVEYIMESCISNGHKSLSYMEKRAVCYAKNGISSLDKAKSYDRENLSILNDIYKVFGLKHKRPPKKEIDYVSKWTGQYGFSDDIIIEACSRTVEHTHSDSFPYADSILTNWYNNDAKSMDDIRQLDLTHSKEVKSLYPDKNAKNSTSRPKNSHSFTEREYDYDSLEAQLQRRQNERIKKILGEDRAKDEDPKLKQRSANGTD